MSYTIEKQTVLELQIVNVTLLKQKTPIGFCGLGQNHEKDGIDVSNSKKNIFFSKPDPSCFILLGNGSISWNSEVFFVLKVIKTMAQKPGAVIKVRNSFFLVFVVVNQ